MTKRLKLFLIFLLGAIAAACFAVGCRVGTPDRGQLLAPYKGGHVTYYANGGWFNRNASINVRELYYKTEDAPFFDVSEGTDGIDVMCSGYDFIGWFEPVRHESGDHAGEIIYTYAATGEEVYQLFKDGTPVTDSTEDRPVFCREGKDEQILEKDVRLTPSENQVTSEKLVAADEELVVCAKWEKSLSFVFKLSVEDKTKTYTYNDKSYSYGDVISEMPFGKKETNNPGDTLSVAFDGMTFVSNYADEELSQFVGEYSRADYEGKSEIVIWSKFIEGSWTIVRNKSSSVQTMFNGLNSSSKRFYIIEDIDCSSATIGLGNGVRATVEGNGYTISNIKIDRSNAPIMNGVTVGGVFGAIYSTAVINNLTLKDIDIKIKGSGELAFYAICSSVENGAKLENLTIDTVKANVDAFKGVTNVQNGDTSNWLFGGHGTDAQFLATHSGVRLQGDTAFTTDKLS